MLPPFSSHRLSIYHLSGEVIVLFSLSSFQLCDLIISKISAYRTCSLFIVKVICISTYPTLPSVIAIFSNVQTQKNITYLNAYLLKSSKFFRKLKVITSKVPSYGETLDQDDGEEIKASRYYSSRGLCLVTQELLL